MPFHRMHKVLCVALTFQGLLDMTGQRTSREYHVLDRTKKTKKTPGITKGRSFSLLCLIGRHDPWTCFWHFLHHNNIHIGPWSGMSMHPVEHIIYISSALVHFIIASRPVILHLHLYIRCLAPAFRIRALRSFY